MKIEVLGTGCPKCKATLSNVEAAVQELGVEAEIVKVDQVADIVARGVMLTPAVAVDGQVVISGHVATLEELKQHLRTP